MATTVVTLPNARQQFFDANGNPLAGGSVAHYTPGTLTPASTWQDYQGTVLNANPLTLDAAGSCEIYATGPLRQIVKDALANTIYDQVVATTTAGATIATIAALRALSGAITSPMLYVLGYTAAGDGGQGMFTLASWDTTSADNGATIIVDGSGNRWHRESSEAPLSVMWFGAKGDGSTDDTTAIQAGINAAQTLGRELYFPGATTHYKITGTLHVTAAIIMRGDFATAQIATSSATADMLDIAAQGVVLSELTFTSSVARTAGAYVSIGNTSSEIKVERCRFFDHAIGLQTAGTTIDIVNCTFFDTVASTGIGILITAGSDVALRHLLINSGASPEPFAGIDITGAGDIVIDDCNIISHNTSLLFNPPTGVEIDSVYVSNSFFDTSTSYGLQILPSGTGKVQRCRFIGCWFSSHGIDGVVIGSFGGGTSATVKGLEFIDCHAFANSNNGFNYDYGQDITWIGCQAAGNTAAGLSIAAGMTNFTVIGNTFGPAGGFGGNAYGIWTAAGATDELIIVGNHLEGNGTSNFANVISPVTAAQIVRDNLGYISAASGSATIGSAATSVTVTHGLSGTPPLANILLTMISGLGSAQVVWVSATGATTFTVTAGAAPGTTIGFNWRAALSGDV